MDCSVQIIKRGVKIEKEILEWIISIAVALVILFIVSKFIATPYTIKGESMDPTLKDGERVAVNIIGYKTGGLEKVMSLFSMQINKMIM